MHVNPQRILQISSGPDSNGPVIYWMQRDQRIRDNWALLHAQELALESNKSLRIVFCLADELLGISSRQYHFLILGLKECLEEAKSLNIPLEVLAGNPCDTLAPYLHKHQASHLVMDFDPLRKKARAQEYLLQKIPITAYLVDTHNIVPCWIASNKQEFAARTIRPKIHKKLDEFLEPIPAIKPHPHNPSPWTPTSFQEPQSRNLNLYTESGPVNWIVPGSTAGLQALENFIQDRLPSYSEKRNDPNRDSLSHLSPYLHFGQISAQRVALRVKKELEAPLPSRESFLEELIVRKELSDNFCHFNPNYDNFQGLPHWAKKTLNKHRRDTREHLYSLQDFEWARTHDHLWNAAQTEMLHTGKMHGYMRMYWAKKILEWTQSPEQALEWAIYLNDKYELDGCDPNGYTGILWSIGGLHDRGWKERPVFGTVRYMSYNGCRRKFDVNSYIGKWS